MIQMLLYWPKILNFSIGAGNEGTEAISLRAYVVANLLFCFLLPNFLFCSPEHLSLSVTAQEPAKLSSLKRRDMGMTLPVWDTFIGGLFLFVMKAA